MRVSHVFFLYLAICIIVCIVCIRLHSRACAQEPSRGKRVVGCRRSMGLSCPPAPPPTLYTSLFLKTSSIIRTTLLPASVCSVVLCSALLCAALLCSPRPPCPPCQTRLLGFSFRALTHRRPKHLSCTANQHSPSFPPGNFYHGPRHGRGGRCF